MVVNAHYDGDIFIGCRCGNNHLFGAGLYVHSGFFLGSENTGGFQHDIDFISLPGEFGGIFHRIYFNCLPVNDQLIILGFNLARKGSMYGIVLEEVCQGGGIGQIVNCNKFNVLVLACGPQYHSADSAETVDSYP